MQISKLPLQFIIKIVPNMEKLYGLYSVISNKTVRKHEKKHEVFRKKGVPGILIKTNRGYFIDGRQVDQKSVEIFFAMYNAK